MGRDKSVSQSSFVGHYFILLFTRMMINYNSIFTVMYVKSSFLHLVDLFSFCSSPSIFLLFFLCPKRSEPTTVATSVCSTQATIITFKMENGNLATHKEVNSESR